MKISATVLAIAIAVSMPIAALAENKKLDEEDSSYDKLFEKEVLTSIQNLPVDMSSINADESKKARNDEWLKGVKKDVYLLETLNIMHDLLVIK